MPDVTIPEGLIRPEVELSSGVDGNAFMIMGKVCRALRKAGNSEAVVQSYCEQCHSGNYDHLLTVTQSFVEAS